MVMTTKHHEGFCLFNTQYTDYCAPKQGPGRDLVKEYVEAARGEGLRVGFYHSLMDWHHPDGARCATDEAARRRFGDYVPGQSHELLTNSGKHAITRDCGPGKSVSLAGRMTQVKSAGMLATGAPVKFEQEKFRVRFTGLPGQAHERV